MIDPLDGYFMGMSLYLGHFIPNDLDPYGLPDDTFEVPGRWGDKIFVEWNPDRNYQEISVRDADGKEIGRYTQQGSGDWVEPNTHGDYNKARDDVVNADNKRGRTLKEAVERAKAAMAQHGFRSATPDIGAMKKIIRGLVILSALGLAKELYDLTKCVDCDDEAMGLVIASGDYRNDPSLVNRAMLESSVLVYTNCISSGNQFLTGSALTALIWNNMFGD